MSTNYLDVEYLIDGEEDLEFFRSLGYDVSDMEVTVECRVWYEPYERSTGAPENLQLEAIITPDGKIVEEIPDVVLDYIEDELWKSKPKNR